MAVRFTTATGNFRATSALPHCRSVWNSDEISCISVNYRRKFHSGSGCFNIAWSGLLNFNADSLPRRTNLRKKRTQATAEHLGSPSDPEKQSGKSHYHPSEDIAELTAESRGDARLTAAETTRTVIEVNNKAMILLTDLMNNDGHENFIWPDLPYLTDENGNVYFQVKNDEDILQSLTSDSNYVQVIIGFDTMEMIKGMELQGPSEIDFGIEDIEDENSDSEDEDEGDSVDEDDDYEEDWVAVLDEDEDAEDEDDTLGDWAKLETMRSSHPMFFAKMLAEVASDDPAQWLEQPPAGLAIQGLLRPVLIEEHSNIKRHMSDQKSQNVDINKSEKITEENSDNLGMINGDERKSPSSADNPISAEESAREGNAKNGTTFYKLEMINLQLITAHGHQSAVELEDFRRAQPDALAHSASKIISRLNESGEKTTEALKSLCWRCKGIQVEEAKLIGVDSLGFDLRVCSGRQIQTLRFSFATRATSEYSAERQLNDLLFLRNQQKSQKKRQTHQNEC